MRCLRLYLGSVSRRVMITMPLRGAVAS